MFTGRSVGAAQVGQEVCVWGVTLGERTCPSAPDSGHEPKATCLSSCQPIFSWEAQVVSVTGL